MTISKLYSQYNAKLEKTSSSPALDVEVIFCHVLGKDKSFIISHPEFEPAGGEVIKIKKLIGLRKKGIPIAYLTRHKEFFGHDFLVDENVLIPRPESEWLVEQALERIMNFELRIKNKNNAAKSMIQNSIFNILDLGTGSGCLAISLAKGLQKLQTANCKLQTNLHASDISKKALIVAKRNAKRVLFNSSLSPNNKIKFIHSDLFSNHLLHRKYDLIIANLPYVPLEAESLNHKAKSIDYEPEQAIFADDNGSSIIKKFVKKSLKYINKNGLILIELDPRNALELEEFAKSCFPSSKIKLIKDLAGLDRYLKIHVE